MANEWVWWGGSMGPGRWHDNEHFSDQSKDMTNYKRKKVNVPFCRQGWKFPSVILILAILSTFAWGFHLLRDHRAELDGVSKIDLQSNRSILPGASSLPVVGGGGSPMDTVVRASLVNIAGIERAANGGNGRFVSRGSGVIITPNGHIATANHLLDGLKEILVRIQTPSGPRQYSAQLLKAVSKHDLAVLKVVSRDLFPHLIPGDSRSLSPGDPVTAWGDPDGASAIRRTGMVSGLSSPTSVTIGTKILSSLIPTNAVYHWTQGGGPLVNDRGRLLGVNLAVQSSTGGVTGFAIPVHVLFTHFQDVVNFPVPLPVAQNPVVGQIAPAAAPVFLPADSQARALSVVGASSMVPTTERVQSRSRRPSDDWWDRAKSILNLNVGLQVPSLSDPSLGNLIPKENTAHIETQRILGYPLRTFLGLLILGFVSGVTGGMMTMGGGIIKVIGLMTFFEYGLLLVRPVAYITNIFMYGAAALRYRRDNLFDWETVRPMVPWAMFGVVLGYFIGNILNSTIIHYLLGGFAFLLGLKMLVELSETRQSSRGLSWLQYYFGSGQEEGLAKRHHNRPAHFIRDGILGLPMGIISGILGITGGVVEVPLQRYVAGVPLRNAIANSAVLVFFASVVGSIVALSHGIHSGSFSLDTPLMMAIILIPGAYIGGLTGAWLTTVVSLNILRWLYAILMFAVAIKMVLS
ncbi:MAG: TSUP family transporter [Magnetococcales bacterium]|nr:TSUP family transporter [Magnetococcales bacterium]